MADFIASAEFRDNLSAGANAATASLLKTADAADKLEVSLTKAGPSAATLVRQLDPATKSALALEAAQRKLAASTATMDAAVAAGTATIAQRNAVVDTLAVRVQALSATTAAAAPLTDKLTDAHGRAANAANMAAGSHAGFTRELIVMGHEVVQGNYTRLPGSMMVLAERSSAAQSAIEKLGGMLLTTGGAMAAVGVAAVAVGGYLVYQAYAAESAFQTLNKTLALTRADYASMAAAATDAAKAVGAVGGGSKADTLTAAGLIAAVPTFAGTQNDMQSLLTLTGRLATALGTDLASASKIVTDGLKDPAAEARALADMGFRYLDDATVSLITHLENSGETTKAQALLMDRLRLSVDPVVNAYKSLADSITAAHVADQQRWSNGPPQGAAALTPDASGRPVLLGPVQADGQRAVGIMQVNPKTAAGLGYNDISTQDSNIAAGLSYIKQLAAGGASNDKIAGSYNLGPTGYAKNPDAAAGYIGKVGAAKVSSLPADIASQIEFWGQSLGLTPEQIALGQRMAVVESGGRQYGAPITTNDRLLSLGTPLGPDAPTEAQLRQSQADQAGFNATMRATGGIATNTGQAQDLQDTIDRMTKAQALTVEGSSDYQKLEERINATRISLEKFNNPLGETIAKLNAEASALLGSADAQERGGVAAIKASAASQAAAQSAGKYIENIDVLTNAILNKNAAQEADKGAKTVSDLHDQAVAAAAAAQAAGASPEDQYYAALDEKIRKATASLQAYADATTDPQIRAALENQISQIGVLDRATASLNETAKARTAEGAQQRNLEYIQAEIGLVGANSEVRARELAILKEKQTIQASMPGLDEAEKQKLLDNAAAIADATSSLQRQQQVANELGNMLTQAFDQVGNAITQAFVNGNGAAVNFGNVARGVMAAVLQEALKLAIINPLLNEIGGTHRSTLYDAGALLGAATGGSGASTLGSIGSGFSLLSTGKSIYSAGSSIYSGGAISPAMDAYAAGLAPGLFGTGVADISGASAGSIAAATAPSGLMSEAAVAGSMGGGAAPMTGAGALGSFSGAATGVGVGYAAGSFIGGAIQRGNHTVGPAPEVGAAGGAVAGAVIGSVVPVIGTIIGGIIGGIVGGAGGGFIGPHAASVYGGVGLQINADQGTLSSNQSISQGMNLAPYQQIAGQQVAATNSYLTANGVKFANAAGNVQDNSTPGNANPTGVQWIGQGKPGDPNFYQDLYTPNSTGKTEFSNFSFTSADAKTNSVLDGKHFQDLSQLQAVVDFVGKTVPALLALGQSATANGTYSTQLFNMNDAFTKAIANATTLGMSTDDLSAAWATAAGKLHDAQTTITNNTDNGYTSRYLTAAASISGNPADAQNAQLFSFDASAQQQRDQFSQTLIATYGDSFKTTQGYTEQMALLEKTLGEERLAIQKSYNSQLIATATTSVTSLSAYVLKLQSGANSPLSPQAQYGLASSQFNAVAGSAQAGNFNSYSNIQSYADSLLNSSRAYNGTGSAYVADFSRVLDVLNSLGSVTPDTLTASIYAAQVQSQTDTLSAGLASIKSAVDALRQQINAPARVAG